MLVFGQSIVKIKYFLYKILRKKKLQNEVKTTLQ